MDITVCPVGNGSASLEYAKRLKDQANNIPYTIAGANVSATLHKVGDLPKDLVELKGLSPDTQVARVVVKHSGYPPSIGGAAFLSDISKLHETVTKAYTNALKNVSHGTWKV